VQQATKSINLHPFVFSNSRQYRIARHTVFWLTWILYYSIVSTMAAGEKVGVLKIFFYNFTVVAQSTPLDMGFCYFIIYFLLPRFLFKGRYITMLLLWLLASFVWMAGFEADSYYIVPHINNWFGFPMPKHPKSFASIVYEMFNLFSQLNMEGCVAASIKLGKLWYVKEQEVELLRQENEKAKMHDEEGLMQPAFLADLLARLQTLADTEPLLAAGSIKRLRNLITYMLYENAQAKASLKKELQLAEEYIELERMMAAHEPITIQLNNNAEANGETIAPSIILPFIENAFRQVYIQPLAERRVIIHIKLQQSVLDIRICWNKPIDTSTLAQGRHIIMQNIARRLQLIYPQSHELKTFVEVEQVRVELSINLRKAINQ